METLHKDYRHATYPRSIGRPEQTREEWLKHITEYMSLWTEFEVSYIGRHEAPFAVAKPLQQMTIHSITGAAGKVILHVRIPNVRIGATST